MEGIVSLLDHGPAGLFVCAFFESIFLPVPPDMLLLALCLVSPAKSGMYALLCTLGSVLGGVAGYYIGKKAGRPVIERFFPRETVEKAESLFLRYGGWAVGVAAFTPVPFKLSTLSAGMFRVPLSAFVAASALGRAGRFFLEGGLVFFLGEKASEYLDGNFEIATVAVTALFLLAVWLGSRSKGFQAMLEGLKFWAEK